MKAPVQHTEELHRAGLRVLKYFDPFISEWSDYATIQDIITHTGDLEANDFFASDITIGLLIHLQHHISDLSQFKTWFDLTVKGIADLRGIITRRVTTKDFDGKCNLCQG